MRVTDCEACRTLFESFEFGATLQAEARHEWAKHGEMAAAALVTERLEEEHINH